MFKRYLDHLRAQPKSYRYKILWIITGSVGLLLLLLWIFLAAWQHNAACIGEQCQRDTGVWRTLRNGAGKFKDNINKNPVEDIKNQN